MSGWGAYQILQQYQKTYVQIKGFRSLEKAEAYFNKLTQKDVGKAQRIVLIQNRKVLKEIKNETL